MDVVFIHNIAFAMHPAQRRLFPYPGTHAWALRAADLDAFCAFLLYWKLAYGSPHNVRRVLPRAGAPVYAVNSKVIGDYIFEDGPPPALLPFDPALHVVKRAPDRAGWPWFEFQSAPPYQALIQGADLGSMQEDLIAAAHIRKMCWPVCRCGRGAQCHRQRLDAMGQRYRVTERVITRMDVDAYRSLIAAVRSRSSCAASDVHGERHWRAVAEIGLVISSQTRGCDPLIVVLFALFHDALRRQDGDDPGHGLRSAALARELCATLPVAARELLAQACAEHADGKVTSDQTLGVCWDADRLTLWRVGVIPDPRWLSTQTAQDSGYIAWARTVYTQPRDWDALYDGLARQFL